jgi:hypothetical protein
MIIYLPHTVLSFLAFIITLLILPSTGIAAAWNQEQGKSLLIINGLYSQSGSFYDHSGEEILGVGAERYELNPYYEYGYSTDITLGGTASLQRLDVNSPVTSWPKTRLTSFEVFARKQLYRDDNWAFALQPMLKFPGLYPKADERFMGERQFSAEMRLSGGYGFEATLPNVPYMYSSTGPQHHFINLELAFRHHGEKGKDEMRFDPTIGFHYSEESLMLLQAFSTFAIGGSGNALVQGNNAFGYDLIKMQISTVKKITPNLNVQLGSFQDLWGKNTIKASGALLSVWYQY